MQILHSIYEYFMYLFILYVLFIFSVKCKLYIQVKKTDLFQQFLIRGAKTNFEKQKGTGYSKCTEPLVKK
jgi:hypothetical protein